MTPGHARPRRSRRLPASTWTASWPCALAGEDWRAAGLGWLLLREGLDRAGGIQLDIRTRAEAYYRRLGATQSAGFRLTRGDPGLPEV